MWGFNKNDKIRNNYIRGNLLGNPTIKGGLMRNIHSHLKAMPIEFTLSMPRSLCSRLREFISPTHNRKRKWY